MPVRSPRPARRSLGRLIVLIAFAVLTAGCFRLPVNGARTPPSGEVGSMRPSTSTSPGASLEGRFSYGEMDEYVDAVLPMITEWAHRTWPDLPDPAQVVYVPHGATGPEGCRDSRGRLARYSARSYEYCGADQRIYVGQDMLWSLYTEAGDAGPAVGLAHEWGHHVQSLLGAPPPASPPMRWASRIRPIVWPGPGPASPTSRVGWSTPTTSRTSRHCSR
ncbi:MAG: neutral zinc metallopeptidase [Micromonosporaceae bacterium]